MSSDHSCTPLPFVLQHRYATRTTAVVWQGSNTSVVSQGQALEDPLDNEEQLQEQLESLPYLCRFQSEKMSSYFCSAFDVRLQRYTAISQGSPPSSNIELQVCSLRPASPPHSHTVVLSAPRPPAAQLGYAMSTCSAAVCTARAAAPPLGHTSPQPHM